MRMPFFFRRKYYPYIKALKVKNKAGGFSLIELLTVIFIIAILVTISTVAFSRAQIRGRDSRRKANIASLQQSLELFYADYGSYPDEQGPHAPSFDWDPYTATHPEDNLDEMTCEIASTFPRIQVPVIARMHVGTPFVCASKTYLGQMPADPKTGKSYFYEIHEHPIASGGTDYGWCDNPTDWRFTSSVLHGHCQKYTLWAKLENLNDPEIARTSADDICNGAKYMEADLNGYNYCVHNNI